MLIATSALADDVKMADMMRKMNEALQQRDHTKGTVLKSKDPYRIGDTTAQVDQLGGSNKGQDTDMKPPMGNMPGRLINVCDADGVYVWKPIDP
jgi:hypothetical protein